MSKYSKMLVASGLLLMSLSVTGCQSTPQAPQQTPEVVLQDGITKLSAATSYGYNVGLKGDLVGPEGKPPAKVSFDLSFNGGVDIKNPQDPKFNLNAKGEFMADSDGGSGEVSFRLNKDAIFANLMKLEGKGAVTIPDGIKQQLVAKWWTMPVPKEALDEIAKSLSQTGSEATMTDEQKQIKAAFVGTKFFKNVKFVGMEPVGGEQSYHYSGDLDKDAMMAFVTKVADIQKQPIDEAAKAEMWWKKSLDVVDFTGDMYVGQTSGVLNQVKGNVVFKPTADKSTPSGTVALSMSLSDLNKSVTVEVPKDAQPVPLETLGQFL